MEKFGRSQPVKRVEDLRFLTGHGRYIDDEAPAGALHLAVVRSPVAHARLLAVDLEEARAVPGVHLAMSAEDWLAAGLELGMEFTTVKNRDGSEGAAPTRPILARGKLRFVGEPVAFVVAESRTAARDAAELVGIDYEELPVKLDLAPGGEALHDEAPDNVAFDWVIGDEEAVAEAFARAAHVVRTEVPDNRVIVNSMEPRGAWAELEEGGRLHLSFGGQGVWGLKKELMRVLGLPEEKVHVTTPDVGGGFGMKAMAYPEYFMVAEAARRLGRPVRWYSERGEAMMSDNAGRDLLSITELAFDEEGRILAYRVENHANMGAYNSQFGQPIQTQLFSRVLTGVYDIPAAFMNTKGYFTNTTQVDAYRGAGRPEAIYALERSMDNAARTLGLDPFELRRRNFIPPARFPYKTITGETYDVGDFARLLARVEEESDRAGFAARRAESAARGRLRGLGLCYYIESILGDPSEGVTVEFEEDGTVSLYVGTQSNGQGHETVYASFLSDQTGIPMEKIRVIQGDSDRIREGGGTGGSRSVTVQTNVTLVAVQHMVKAYAEFLAPQMGVKPEDVTFDDVSFRAEGSNLAPTFLEAAEMARAAGRTDLLKFQEKAKLPGRSYPNGAHVAEVEIDPDTGIVTLERYTVIDDFGNLINPMLARGQVHGGVAQGAGQMMMEHVVYDQGGQLLTASFMDYAMPRAKDFPMMTVEFEPVPSRNNPMGMKGCGEAGTVGALAAVANAVQDAVWELGVRQVAPPFTPLKVWEMLNGGGDQAR